MRAALLAAVTILSSGALGQTANGACWVQGDWADFAHPCGKIARTPPIAPREPRERASSQA